MGILDFLKGKSSRDTADAAFTRRFMSAQNDPDECGRIYQEREQWRKGELLKSKGYPVTPENMKNADYLPDKNYCKGGW